MPVPPFNKVKSMVKLKGELVFDASVYFHPAVPEVLPLYVFASVERL